MRECNSTGANLYLFFLADLSHFKSVIERLQQASAKAEQDPIKDASVGMNGEEVEDLTPNTNVCAFWPM